MDLQETYEMARRQMDEKGLTDWTFDFDRSVRRFGVCNYRKRLISMSEKLVLLNGFDQVFNTLMHEIAHALVGYHAGHGPVWKEKAQSLGCNGERCYSSEEVVMPTPKYEGTCEKCGGQRRRNRMKVGAKYYHRGCGGQINYRRTR